VTRKRKQAREISPAADDVASKDGGQAPADAGLARVLFWVLFLYTLGLAVMVIEDVFTHTFF